MRFNLRRGTIALGMTVALGVTGLTACGSGNGGSYSGRMPAGYPVINGVTYCGYVFDRDECLDSGILPQFWIQMPANDYSYNAAMYNNMAMYNSLLAWHLLYHGYYGSPAYYNHYVPRSKRSSYTKVYLVSFNKTNKTALKTYDKSKSTTVPGVKVSKPPTPFSKKNDGGKVSKTVNCAAGFNTVVVADAPDMALTGRSSGGSGGGSRSHSGSGNTGTKNNNNGGAKKNPTTTGGGSNGGSNGGLPGTGNRNNGKKSQSGC